MVLVSWYSFLASPESMNCLRSWRTREKGSLAAKFGNGSTLLFAFARSLGSQFRFLHLHGDHSLAGLPERDCRLVQSQAGIVSEDRVRPGLGIAALQRVLPTGSLEFL